MKYTFKIIIGLLFFNNSFAQQIDTLKVIVLSPYKIEVADNYLTEYNKLKKEIVENRSALKEQKTKDKQANIEEFNKQPDYTKVMFENELNFYDSLTIDNYVATIVREYIAYRLYKPFKIKPRIILVSTITSTSDKKQYSDIANNKKNFFIINFPKMKFYKEKGELKIQTNIELYSAKTNEILLSKDNIGIPKGGLTDYPMCSGDNWDCAIVNSVYPNLIDVLRIIAEKNAEVK
ncbi:hypothetical protein [Flavobacterium chungangense]|uniref:Uncharacterized protein n=1 Tax=Flavobacterium chungangense TaxID=554283 RepID=A0A6V6ZFP5_9FLAO|nr:hypothetical protein [Flavobacterium chungangense]CAD0009722.1 hypothetical protein FLACHUCJ7_04386 [Flavobacterium chungangense]